MFNHNILKTNQMLKKWYPNTLSDCCNICKIGIETQLHLTIYCDKNKLSRVLCGADDVLSESECG